MGDPVPGADVPAAFIAGLVSFVSPCVLPLVPGYLSAVTGVQVAELGEVGWRRVLAPSLLFIATFSAVFVLIGLGVTELSQALIDNRDVLSDIGAVALIVLGALFIAAFLFPRVGREWRIGGLLARAGRGGPVVAGAAFSIAWTPCAGPVYAGVVALASTRGETGYSAFLLGLYCLGLALPFLLTALAFSRTTTLLGAVRRHYGAIVAGGGAVLIAMGVLILTGLFTELNVEAQRLTSELGLNL